MNRRQLLFGSIGAALSTQLPAVSEPQAPQVYLKDAPGIPFSFLPLKSACALLDIDYAELVASLTLEARLGEPKDVRST